MRANEQHRKKMKIVTMYYKQALTQAEIAKKMNISRPVVSKILQQAKEEGIVTIAIKDESAYLVNLALHLEEKYQLQDVLIVPATEESNAESVRRDIGRSAAQYLANHLKPGLSIGLSWGTTLAAMIDEMSYASFPKLTVCPIVGGVSSEHLYFDTNHLVFRLAEKLTSHCRYFYAPALAESIAFAKALNQSEVVKQALAAAKQVDIAIIGVGNPREHSTWQQLGYLDQVSQTMIQESSVVGDAVASLFDKNGQTVNNEISQRMIGLKVEELAAIPKVIIIGSGKEKTESIKALISQPLCSVIVIDQLTAEALVSKEC